MNAAYWKYSILQKATNFIQVAQGLGVALVHVQGLLVLEQVHHPVEGGDGDEQVCSIQEKDLFDFKSRWETAFCQSERVGRNF